MGSFPCLAIFGSRLCKSLHLAALAFLWSAVAAAAQDTHGFAIYSALKRPADFQHFMYADPAAQQGGRLRQGTTITFNSTNRLRFPGKSPNELTYIYDTLMVRALDEPASFYGLLAGHVDVADDFTTARFTLRPEAVWHDGKPVTAEDVVFTFETLRTHGLPLYRAALKGVWITAEGERTVLFASPNAGDWRYLDAIATFPIHPKHFWKDRDPGLITLDVPLGSGPYQVADLKINDRVLLTRTPDYWARDLAVNRGLWNFDEIETLYFRDQVSLIAALKAGVLDVNREFDAALWTGQYGGPPFENGPLVRSTFPDLTGGRIAALVFNLRRPPLDDVRVREALMLAFDGEWTRDTLFQGLYAEPGPLYGPTDMSARGAASATERAILAPFLDALPKSALDVLSPPAKTSPARRERLRRAADLLKSVGYTVQDGIRVNTATGEPLTLEYIGTRDAFRRVLGPYADALKRLGITLDVRIFDYVNGREAILSHEFDITTSGFRANFPPGIEERIYWHSENALVPGYALAGAQDPALDAAIEAMARGSDYASIVAASRAFERVLTSQHYLLPMWRAQDVWIAHHKDLTFPKAFMNPGFHYVPYMSWAR
ncbi:MAG: extracellular solute-binding protein [Pseudomonadota bacterium]